MDLIRKEKDVYIGKGDFLFRKDFLYSILAAVLLVLSYPPFGVSFLAWGGFVPFLLVIKNKNLKEIFLLSYSFGFILFTSGLLYSLVPYSFYYFVLAALIFPIIIVVFSLLVQFINKNIFSFYIRILLPAVIWVSLEYLCALKFFNIPLSLGLSQYKNLFFIQSADIFGIYGISFIMMLVNSALTEGIYYFRKNLRRQYIIILGIPLGVFFLNFLYGYRCWQNLAFEPPTVKVAIVQGNISTQIYQQAWNPKILNSIKEKFFSLTSEAGKMKPEFIVWPETGINVFNFRVPQIREKIYELAKQTKSFLVIGSPDIDKEGKRYNSTFIISPQGKIIGRYDKNRLVPVVEGFITPGKEKTIISTTLGKIGSVICFESAFPMDVRLVVKKGAELLFVSTNDEAFKNSTITYLHLAMSVFRAIANRRYVVRAANTGFSAIISPLGKILKRSNLSEAMVLKGEVSFLSKQTFYTKYGDLLPVGCIGLTLLGMFRAIKKIKL